jgi:hypothetical protein
MQRQSKLSPRQLNYLKSNNWTSFITVFNEVHNADLKMNLGKINVKTEEK